MSHACALFCLTFFQLTTSQGGRLSFYDSGNHAVILSTHDLTRRSTSFVLRCVSLVITFNSRPHKEVDAVDLTGVDLSPVFQLTTSQGGRRQGGRGSPER